MKLNLSQASLTFKREVRFSMAVTIRFTPKISGEEIVHPNGQIFLLTDLFLVCEKLHPQGKESCNNKEVGMRLCYPPLVAKHLRVESFGSSGILFDSNSSILFHCIG